MTQDLCRAEFEKWLINEQALTATWNERRNCYDEFPAHLAWKAWNARIKHDFEQSLGDAPNVRNVHNNASFDYQNQPKTADKTVCLPNPADNSQNMEWK